MPLLPAFLFPSTLGEVTLHQLSQAGMFIYSSRGKWAFPPLLWSFPPTATFTRFPAPGCWACAAVPAFSGWLIYLQFREGFPLPSSSVPRAPRPLFYISFLLLIIQFLFFPWGPVCPGAMLIWPRVFCGSTVCRLAHLVVCVFPSGLGAGVWPHGKPSWFLHLTWSGDARRGLWVWRSQSFASSQFFPVRCISSICPRFYFRKHTFCFLRLASILESPPKENLLKRKNEVFPLKHARLMVLRI
jgi:hypothetical protein